MRIVLFIVSLGALSYVAYYAITNHEAGADANGPSRPKRALDNVRTSAKNIEETDQKHLDDIDAKTKPE